MTAGQVAVQLRSILAGLGNADDSFIEDLARRLIEFGWEADVLRTLSQECDKLDAEKENNKE
jgi:hypothetical protein